MRRRKRSLFIAFHRAWRSWFVRPCVAERGLGDLG